MTVERDGTRQEFQILANGPEIRPRSSSSPLPDAAAALRVPARDLAAPGGDAPRGEPGGPGAGRRHRPPGRPARAAAQPPLLVDVARAGGAPARIEAGTTALTRIGGGVTVGELLASPLVAGAPAGPRAGRPGLRRLPDAEQGHARREPRQREPRRRPRRPPAGAGRAPSSSRAGRRADGRASTPSCSGPAGRRARPGELIRAGRGAAARRPPGLVQARPEAGRRHRGRERRHLDRAGRGRPRHRRADRARRGGAAARSARARRRRRSSASRSTPARVARAADLAAAAARPITDVRGGRRLPDGHGPRAGRALPRTPPGGG